MIKHLGTTILVSILFGATASAQNFNNRAAVQGFLKQGTLALSDASGYPMRFVVKRAGTKVWCQSSAAPIPVVNGIFNVILSGNANCDSLSNTLSPAVFAHTANSDTFSFDVVVDISKDGFGGTDDATFAGIDIVSTPLSMYANYANTSLNAENAVNATNAATATTATTATSATTATTAGNVSGVVAIANGGTGATSATAARTGLGLGNIATLNSSGSTSQYLRADGTWSTPPTAAVSSVAGKTGAVTLTTSDVGGLGTAATMAATSFMQADITSLALTGAGTALTITNNASIGGNLAVTGAVTANLIGNVTGNVTGTVTGPINGNITGNVTGNLTGNVTGNLTGTARQANTQSSLTTAGTGTAYTLTLSPTIATGPIAGTAVMFKAHTTNTGAATLNVDGTGAKNIVSQKTGAALAPGDLVINSFVRAVYDGTNWVADLPMLYFTATALNCGASATANNTVTCPNIAAANVNAGDIVHCSPVAEPATKVLWSARTTASNISIRMSCSNNNTGCTLTNVNWKCVVVK